MIWVSPRSNSAEPCTRGSTSTSAASWRMSSRPRPSMRTLSCTMRRRTRVLVSERNAARDLLLAALEAGRRAASRTLRLDGVGRGLALLLAGDLHRGGEVGLAGLGHGGEHVVLVVEEDRELERLLGRLGLELVLRAADRGDRGLGGLEALGDDLLGRRGAAGGDDVEDLLRGLGLDHHDRDVAVVEQAAGDDHVEGRLGELLGGREGDPAARRAGDAGGADRAGERQAGQQHRRGGRVDGEHVVQVRRGRARGRSRRPGPRCAGPS